MAPLLPSLLEIVQERVGPVRVMTMGALGERIGLDKLPHGAAMHSHLLSNVPHRQVLRVEFQHPLITLASSLATQLLQFLDTCRLSRRQLWGACKKLCVS